MKNNKVKQINHKKEISETSTVKVNKSGQWEYIPNNKCDVLKEVFTPRLVNVK